MSDRLGELSRSNALLGAALAELRETGISNATADALAGVGVSDADFSEFLSLAARDIPQTSVFGLALSLPEYIDRRNAGHDALDYCLVHGGLSKEFIVHVVMRMDQVTKPESVVWCHNRLATVIKLDNEYYHFLRRHLDVILRHCRDEMTAYLLYPKRGPEPTNIDAFELVTRFVDDPAPFFTRWREWVVDGLLNPEVHASYHYQILNDHWDNPAYSGLRRITDEYIHSLLRSPDPQERAYGARHVKTMIGAHYRGIRGFVSDVSRQEFPDLYLELITEVSEQ